MTGGRYRENLTVNVSVAAAGRRLPSAANILYAEDGSGCDRDKIDTSKDTHGHLRIVRKSDDGLL